MVPGFHSSSLGFHDIATVVGKLAEMGFAAIAVRPQRGIWDHDRPWFDDYTSAFTSAAKEHSVELVVDLDAPFYQSPDRYHPDSLVSSDPNVRAAAFAYLKSWIERASVFQPSVVSFSSGLIPPDQIVTPSDQESMLECLAETIDPLSALAHDAGIQLALRPVAGHAIATVAHFERFGQWLAGEAKLGLAADVGEMLQAGEFPIGARLARLKHRLACVYLCEPDLEHARDQRFGFGDIDLGRVWEVMTESGFAGPAIFRVCGHEHLGLELAREAIALTTS